MTATKRVPDRGGLASVATVARGFRFLETLSLDVASGVLGAALFLATLSRPAMPRTIPIAVLVALVLAIYNFDHLQDALRPGARSTPRRRRYDDRKPLLAAAMVTGSVIALLLAPWLAASTWLEGGMVGLYQAAYFAALRVGLRGAPKRVLAALGWAAGTAVPICSTRVEGPVATLALGVVLLALLAWINLQSYALVDARAEEEDPRSLPPAILRVAALAAVAGVLALAFATHPECAGHWTALAAVAVVQAALIFLPPDLAHPVGEWAFALLGLSTLL